MIVYTTVFNDYDLLHKPPSTLPDTRFVCFTDNLLPSCSGWEMHRVSSPMTERRNALYHKILSTQYFPDQEITIWHGGTVQLNDNLETLASLVKERDIAVLRASDPSCVYTEAGVCIQSNLDNPAVIANQMARYRMEGYPPTVGLSLVVLIVRRNTHHTRTFEETWWGEVDRGSELDHLSFDYACWKTGITPATIPGTGFAGPYHTQSSFYGP